MTSLATDDLEGMSMPLNQGNFGTCVAFAFTKVLTDSILHKYGVALDYHAIIAAIKFSNPDIFEGGYIVEMCKAWNKKYSDKWFEDIDKQKRYQIKIKHSDKKNDINEVYDHVRKYDQVLLTAVCISTSKNAHNRHAIAVDHAYDERPILRGCNSWGAERTTIDIDDKNFHYAFFVDPEITGCKEGSWLRDVPPVQKAYTEVSLKAQRQKEEEARRKKEIEDAVAKQKKEDDEEMKQLKLELEALKKAASVNNISQLKIEDEPIDWEVLTEIVGEENVAILKQGSAFTGKLDFYEKKITSEHCKVLAPALSKMKALEALYLGFNKIGDAGLEHLSKALPEMKALNNLNLTLNQVGDAGLAQLSKALPEMKVLNKLDLSRNQIGDAGLQHLSNALAEVKALRELCLYENQIGDVGLQHLSKTLPEMEALKQLWLSHNQIGDAGLEHLSKALPEMKALHQLWLNNNQIGEEVKSKFKQEWESEKWII